MTRLLLVEDEVALARAFATALRDAGYVVDVAHDVATASAGWIPGLYDALLLDLRLPDGNGLELVRRLRAAGDARPVLIVTGCDATDEVVAGLDAGADDYITKPFAVRELLARLRALLRRGAATAPGSHGGLRCGDLEITADGDVRCGGRRLALGALERRLLDSLARGAGEARSRERLAGALWADESLPESNALEVHVSALRRKLATIGSAVTIRTLRGFGYRLELPRGAGEDP